MMVMKLLLGSLMLSSLPLLSRSLVPVRSLSPSSLSSSIVFVVRRNTRGRHFVLNRAKSTLMMMSTTTTTKGSGDVDDDVDRKNNNSIIIHFNHAGSSPSPQVVTQRIIHHTQLEQRIGGYAAAESVSNELDQVYNLASQLIHADTSTTSETKNETNKNVNNTIALMESATVAWTRAFYSMAQTQLNRNKNNNKNKKKNVILTSDVEYAANVVAMCQWAKDYNWTVLSIPSSTKIDNNNNSHLHSSSTGIVDIQQLDQMLSGTYTYQDEQQHGITRMLDPSNIALVCVTHVPTNSGVVNPVEEIGQRILSYNNKVKEMETAKTNDDDNDTTNNPFPSIFYLVDACQSIGQMDVNIQQIHPHGMVATGRKYLRGPRGTGFLYISSDIVNDLLPHHIDHYGVPIRNVPTLLNSNNQTNNENEEGTGGTTNNIPIQNLINFQPRNGATRFEFWESNIANRLGLGQAIQYALNVGIENIERDITNLANFFRTRLGNIPRVHVYHSGSSRCGIVTFYIEDDNDDNKKKDHHQDCSLNQVKEQLLKHGFEITSVPNTSTPIDSAKMNAPNLLRASVSYTTTEDEIDKFCDCLSEIITNRHS